MNMCKLFSKPNKKVASLFMIKTDNMNKDKFKTVSAKVKGSFDSLPKEEQKGLEEQLSTLKDEVHKLSKVKHPSPNLWEKSRLLPGCYPADGSLNANPAYQRTPLLDVAKGEHHISLTLFNDLATPLGSVSVVFFNKAREVITSYGADGHKLHFHAHNANQTVSLTIPEQARYFGISSHLQDLPEFKVEYGQPYSPYVVAAADIVTKTNWVNPTLVLPNNTLTYQETKLDPDSSYRQVMLKGEIKLREFVKEDFSKDLETYQIKLPASKEPSDKDKIDYSILYGVTKEDNQLSPIGTAYVKNNVLSFKPRALTNVFLDFFEAIHIATEYTM